MKKRIGILALGLLLAGCGDELSIDSPAENPTTSSTCGNGIVDAAEACDDANRTDGDGCSATCHVERGYQCGLPGFPCRRVH